MLPLGRPSERLPWATKIEALFLSIKAMLLISFRYSHFCLICANNFNVTIMTDVIVEKIGNASHDDRRWTVELPAIFLQISRSLPHITITETLKYGKLFTRWALKQMSDCTQVEWVGARQEFLQTPEFLPPSLLEMKLGLRSTCLKPKDSLNSGVTPILPLPKCLKPQYQPRK